MSGVDPYGNVYPPVQSVHLPRTGVSFSSSDGGPVDTDDAFAEAQKSPGSLTDEIRKERDDAKRGRTPDKAKAGPPTLAEWQDLFGRIVIRIAWEWYVSWCFRGVPEEVIADEDINALKLSRDERRTIAAPLAELANKLQVTKKYGRTIVAGADSVEAMFEITLKMNKVRRIAKKYEQYRQPVRRQKRERIRETSSGGPGPGTNGRPDISDVTAIYNPGNG